MASEEPLFDPTLKKKKKKKVVAFNEDPLGADADPTYPAAAEAAAAAPTVHEQMKTNGTLGDEETAKPVAEPIPAPPDDEMAMFGELKKKKKKKIPMDLEESIPVEKPVSTPAPVVDGDEPPAADAFDLSDLKKRKKSSKKKAQMDLEAFEKELGAEKSKEDEEGEGEGGEDDELGEDPFAVAEDAAPGVVGINTGKEPWIGSERDYKYSELLSRFFAALHAANPALASSMGKRYTIAPPQMVRDGNKKSIFANITDICRRMHRQPEHVIAFMLAEMGTTGSVDGSGRLVIKGRFQQKQVENVLRRYIVEYVTCKTCKSPDTILTKENRIYFMSCESCGSRRSVSAIKSGFQAQIGKRKKAVT